MSYTDDPIYEPETFELHPSKERHRNRHQGRNRRHRYRRKRISYALRVFATDLKRNYTYKPPEQLSFNFL